ncbi:MAG: hypothetical protein E4H09_00445 [Spirochaetales bacterium]|nr:MAG: hypothetical protein E4H09_00445 [Spirochaetales bacterium]
MDSMRLFNHNALVLRRRYSMKLGVSHQSPEMLTPGHLAYLRQAGVEAVEVRMPYHQYSSSVLKNIKARVEDAGLQLHEVMLADRYNCTEIVTGGPQSDTETNRFCDFVEDLGMAGITATTYAWHTGGAYQTGTAESRECATREFRLDVARAMQCEYSRSYSADEVWDNYERFITRVLPIAQDAGVRLQLHPNDPPVDHAGVPRIFSSTAAFARAMEFASYSPCSGILFCVGTWAEMSGADGSGEDIDAAIRQFGSRGVIHQVHLRNIDRPLPDFVETLPDAGYLDLPGLVRTLAEIGFDGMIVPDHVPLPLHSDADRRTMEAFSLGFIRGIMLAAGA